MRVDGLGEVVIHAGGEATLPVFRAGTRGHGDDGDVLVRALLAAHLGGSVIPVHSGHLAVHEDGLVRPGPGESHGLDSVPGDVHAVAEEAEVVHGDDLVDLVVLGQQDQATGADGALAGG